MKNAIAVLIPTLGRAHRVRPLVDNLNATTDARIAVYFVVERDDTPTINAVRRADAVTIINEGPSTYASCIDTAYRKTDEPFIFLGADDIVFTDGCLEVALAEMTDPSIGVVGTADPLWPLPDHSSHSLVRRRYVEERSGCIDIANTVLYFYLHGFTDHELVGVAKSRHAYVYCEQAKVEHHHPGWDKLGRVRVDRGTDDTYLKGNRNQRRDTVTFIDRSKQWIHQIDAPSAADLGMETFIARNRGVRGALRYILRRR